MTGPLFLVGFMGSGKSAVGRRVAQQLDLEFRDCDRLIAAAAGKTVEEIFREDGEAAFRETENRVVEQLCTGGALVAATGGGAFLSFRTRSRMIVSGITVWLDVPLPVIRTRLAADRPDRPLYDRDDPVGMRLLYEKRMPSYALARHRVDGTDLERAVEQVVRLIRGR
jgi:shikimate kinase